MNENDLERLLKKAIFSENGPDPSEEEIEACLRADHEDTPETIARVKKRFVEKMFLEISPNPLRSAADNLRRGVYLFTGIDPTKGSKTDDPLDADHIEETELEGK